MAISPPLSTPPSPRGRYEQRETPASGVAADLQPVVALAEGDGRVVSSAGGTEICPASDSAPAHRRLDASLVASLPHVAEYLNHIEYCQKEFLHHKDGHCKDASKGEAMSAPASASVLHTPPSQPSHQPAGLLAPVTTAGIAPATTPMGPVRVSPLNQGFHCLAALTLRRSHHRSPTPQ